MKIGVLTSSRADFGIYQPLLKRMVDDGRFEVEIIAFGTHLSPYHGYTIRNITEAGFAVHKQIQGMPLSDVPEAIGNAYGNLVINFSQFWAESDYDWVLALGDRYEMSAAVQAGIPMSVHFAHLHGGETTLGAKDNIYRHQITLASALHLVATQAYAEKVQSLVGQQENVFWVGALSLDGIEDLQTPKWRTIADENNLPAEDGFILVTFHPETVNYDLNNAFCEIASDAMQALAASNKIIITMPNADQAGSIYRKRFELLKAQNPEQIYLVENFGRLKYFSAIKHARFLLGNTSSGIIEAASFGKYVVNVGDRQKNRAQSDNIINVPFNRQKILTACQKAAEKGNYSGSNIYSRPNTSTQIIKLLLSNAKLQGTPDSSKSTT